MRSHCVKYWRWFLPISGKIRKNEMMQKLKWCENSDSCQSLNLKGTGNLLLSVSLLLLILQLVKNIYTKNKLVQKILCEGKWAVYVWHWNEEWALCVLSANGKMGNGEIVTGSFYGFGVTKKEWENIEMVLEASFETKNLN